MRKAIVILLFAALVVAGLVSHNAVVNGQEKPAASEKLVRWDGHIVRVDNDNMYMDVRNSAGVIKRIHWDSSTLWTKLNKKVEDHSEFKQEERVICLGKVGEKGEYTASRIDLRIHP